MKHTFYSPHRTESRQNCKHNTGLSVQKGVRRSSFSEFLECQKLKSFFLVRNYGGNIKHSKLLALKSRTAKEPLDFTFSYFTTLWLFLLVQSSEKEFFLKNLTVRGVVNIS